MAKNWPTEAGDETARLVLGMRSGKYQLGCHLDGSTFIRRGQLFPLPRENAEGCLQLRSGDKPGGPVLLKKVGTLVGASHKPGW